MPSKWPAGPSSLQVLSGNYRQTGASTPITALTGDVICSTPTGATVVNLPLATLGGPVTVHVNAAFAVTVKTTDGATIEGIAGATGVAFTGVAGASVGGTFVVDASGTNWVKFST